MKQKRMTRSEVNVNTFNFGTSVIASLVTALPNSKNYFDSFVLNIFICRILSKWIPCICRTFGLFNRFNTAVGAIKSDVITTINPTTGEVVSESGAGEYVN